MMKTSQRQCGSCNDALAVIMSDNWCEREVEATWGNFLNFRCSVGKVGVPGKNLLTVTWLGDQPGSCSSETFTQK